MILQSFLDSETANKGVRAKVLSGFINSLKDVELLSDSDCAAHASLAPFSARAGPQLPGSLLLLRVSFSDPEPTAATLRSVRWEAQIGSNHPS